MIEKNLAPKFRGNFLEISRPRGYKPINPPVSPLNKGGIKGGMEFQLRQFLEIPRHIKLAGRKI